RYCLGRLRKPILAGMNKLLMAAFQLRKMRPAPEQGALDVHIVTDLLPADCRRMLSPWFSWLNILSCGETEPADIRPNQVVIGVGADTSSNKALYEIGPKTRTLKECCEK